jgi:hypothetical protein
MEDARDKRKEWTNIRMQRVLSRPFCPKCYLFLEEHDDEACDMRWEEDKPVCATSAPKLPSLESLQSLDGDSGFSGSQRS